MKTVRDGKKVWPYCIDCGCRLNYEAFSNTELKFYHFTDWEWNGDFSDSRGHSCKSLFKTWIAPKYRVIVGV